MLISILAIKILILTLSLPLLKLITIISTIKLFLAFIIPYFLIFKISTRRLIKLFLFT